MAKKKKAAAKDGKPGVPAAPTAATVRRANVRVVIDVPEGSEPYYSNHVEFGCTKFDFFMLCSRMPSKPSADTFARAVESGELHVSAQVQVVFPASLVPGIIRALTTQQERYEKENGKIPDLGANAPKPTKAETNAKPSTKTH